MKAVSKKKTDNILSEKVKTLLLYIVSSCMNAGHDITRSKIYKIFYFIDFGSYAKHSKSVTNSKYLRFTYGPVPQGINDCLSILADTGELKKEMITKEDNLLEVYKLMKAGFDINVFNETERKIIENTLKFFIHKPVTAASNISHHHYSWLSTKVGEIIPYDKAKKCDFEWLDYFKDSDKDYYLELENTRKIFSSPQMQDLVSSIQQ